MTRKERVELVLELFEQGLKNIAEELREILENAKEPCKHEPAPDRVELSSTGTLSWFHHCKHCGAKIKAKEWISE